MWGFLLRLLSRVALIIAVIVAVFDAIRFVATSVFAFTPLGALIAGVGADPQQGTGFLSEAGHGMVDPLLALPAVGVFLAVSFFAWLGGYRRPKSPIPFDIPQSR